MEFRTADLIDAYGSAVRVIECSASLQSALAGEVVVGLAAANDWSGPAVFGAVRDTAVLGQLGIEARDSNPSTVSKAGAGQINVPVRFGGDEFVPGDSLYGDAVGVVLSDRRH